MVGLQGIKTGASISICGRGPGDVGKRKMLHFFFFLFKLIRDGVLNCLLSAVSALFYNT